MAFFLLILPRACQKMPPLRDCRNSFTAAAGQGLHFSATSHRIQTSPCGGALVSTGMWKPKWQVEAPLAS